MLNKKHKLLAENIKIGIGALIVNKCGSILLLQKKKKIRNKILWTIPGGKINYGESPIETLVRECKEETGLEIVECKLGGFINFKIRNIQWVSLFFIITKYKGNVRLLEDEPFDDYAWFDMNALPKIDLITKTTISSFTKNLSSFTFPQ